MKAPKRTVSTKPNRFMGQTLGALTSRGTEPSLLLLLAERVYLGLWDGHDSLGQVLEPLESGATIRRI
jgi:hypothetical protein